MTWKASTRAGHPPPPSHRHARCPRSGEFRGLQQGPYGRRIGCGQAPRGRRARGTPSGGGSIPWAAHGEPEEETLTMTFTARLEKATQGLTPLQRIQLLLRANREDVPPDPNLSRVADPSQSRIFNRYVALLCVSTTRSARAVRPCASSVRTLKAPLNHPSSRPGCRHPRSGARPQATA